MNKYSSNVMINLYILSSASVSYADIHKTIDIPHEMNQTSEIKLFIQNLLTHVRWRIGNVMAKHLSEAIKVKERILEKDDKLYIPFTA